MNLQEQKEQLREKLFPLIEREGYVVFGFNLFYAAGGLNLKILVDFKEGGISLEECASLNRKIYLYLEENNLLKEEYNLEVSSPGIMKKYTHPRDLIRVKGRQIWVKVEGEGEIKEYQGRCLGVEDNSILKLEADKAQLRIPLDSIREAKEKI